MENKRPLGRPRLHEVGKWTPVQFRIPKIFRENLLVLLEERNKDLPYRLSLNSFLLELIEKGMKSGNI